VRVMQTASIVRLTSHMMQMKNSQAVDYNATMVDQFNAPMRQQPKFTYSVLEGPGQIDDKTGLFTAAEDATGHVVVSATANGVTGTVGATVEPARKKNEPLPIGATLPPPPRF